MIPQLVSSSGSPTPFSLHSSLASPPPMAMALSSGLRITASSFLRLRLRVPLSPPRSLGPRIRLSELRFLTDGSPAAPFSCTPLTVASKAGRGSEETKASTEDGEGGDGNGNGSLAVKNGRVVPSELHKEATEAYMSYAMSVLLGRALPDVRDGLKPVHRRILYAMHELGLSSRKPHKKCARVVGEVLGKFHPHGDNAVYDALVRMAQDFSLRLPLVQGHGNFGSIDADPPAAMRYTECRLEALAEAMLLADLEQDTVDFVPNFDNSQKEPSLLPARIPALLLNGSSGIAVGMATNIPPHNLGELVDALSVLIHNPQATMQEILEYMPGPDFPTGGVIMGSLGILEAYQTGRGRIVVRGKTEIEVIDPKSKRTAIIIKEIPYQTNKASLVEKIAELVENKSLEGISDIRDESDRTGMRIFIEVKRGSDPSVVLNNIYRKTALQSSFSCNMVGILNGEPKLMSLKEMLQAFLDFRCSVVERRARFKLSQAQERRHIVEGIIVGLENLDEVISVIRKASTNAMALADLRNEFRLSQKQGEALLGISLGKLTLLEKKKYVDEDKSLMEQISNLQDLLSSKKQLLRIVEEEATEIKNKFSTPRCSVLEDADGGELEDIDVIPNEEILLALSGKGYVKRLKPDAFNLQKRGTIGKSVGKLRGNDTMSDFIFCHAHDHVLYFSDKGIVYSARAYKIPECTRAAAGTPLIQVLSLSDGERITSIIPVSDFAKDQYLLMLTTNGYIKKASLNFFSSIRSTGIIAIQLVPGDELKWVRVCTNDDLVTMASQNGMVVLCSCERIRALNRNTRGSVAMRLRDGDKLASVDIIPASLAKDMQRVSDVQQNYGRNTSGPWLLFVTENGYGKRVRLSSFRQSPLNKTGLIGYKFALKEDRLASVFAVGFSLAEDGESDEQIILVSQSGSANRIKVRDVSIQSRFARGVILMRLDYSGKIQSASLFSATETESGESDSVNLHADKASVQ